MFKTALFKVLKPIMKSAEYKKVFFDGIVRKVL
jgi:hypothetical protein